MMYRVVEINSSYDPWFGPGKGWIYVSMPVMCYRIALRLAIIHEKRLPWNKTWVQAI